MLSKTGLGFLLFGLLLIAGQHELSCAKKKADIEAERETEPKIRARATRFKSIECGRAPLNPLTKKRNKSPQGYIVNGQRQHGALVSDRHVVTAGHCVEMMPGSSLGDFNVTLGDHSIKKRDFFETNSGISAICRDKNYDDVSSVPMHHDFGVITLAMPVRFSDYIQPACLATNSTDIDEKTCHVLGAGFVKKTLFYNTKAKHVQTLPVRRVSCKRWVVVDEGNFCWTKKDGPGDTCDGDSGGPILCLDKQRQRWHLVGVTSYGTNTCDGTGLQGWDGVYLNVAHHRNNIRRSCAI